MLDRSVVHDHVVKDSIVDESTIVSQDIAQLLIASANPIDHFLPYQSTMTILRFVDCMNVQIIIELTLMKKFDQRL
jgi:hypothetical protein